MPRPFTTYAVTYKLPSGAFELVVVHAHSPAEATSYALGTLERPTEATLARIAGYDPMMVGALYGLTYTPEDA